LNSKIINSEYNQQLDLIYGGKMHFSISLFLAIALTLCGNSVQARTPADDILLESDDANYSNKKENSLDQDLESEDLDNLNSFSRSARKNSNQKDSDRYSKRRRNQYDWTSSTPLWFHSFNKSSFTISLGANSFISSLTSESSGKEYTLKQNNIWSDLALNYSFEKPFFITLKTSSRLKNTSELKFSDPNIQYTDPVEKRSFEGLAEPQLSFGGIWANPDFSIGGQITSIIATDPESSEIFISSATLQQNVYNSTSGGSGINASVFASYNYTTVLFDIGFDYTKKDQQNSVTTTTDYSVSNSSPTISKTTGYSIGESQQTFTLGLEFQNAGKFGIHYMNLTEPEYSEFTQSKTETRYKPMKANGLAFSSKIKVNPFFAIKPLLLLIDSSGGQQDSTAITKDAKLSGYSLSLAIDLSF
jgi:hypothetical protein